MTVDEIIKNLRKEPEQWQERKCFGEWSVESKFHGGAHRIFGDDWTYVNHDNLNEGGLYKIHRPPTPTFCNMEMAKPRLF